MKYGEPSAVECACGTGGKGCGCLNGLVFGNKHLHAWYWVRVEEEAPDPIEPPKSPKPSKRHIELSVVRVEDDKVTFKIVAQTHRYNEFSQQNNPRKFTASNRFQLWSSSKPEWQSRGSSLFCRGNITDKDNLELVCTVTEFAKISEAVAEYNETAGKGYEKPWPIICNSYYYVNENCTVICNKFNAYDHDYELQKLGNFFRTYEEAEVAAEKIKALLKELANK